MKIWQGIVIAIIFITSVCGSACGDCDEEHRLVESGDYRVLDRHLGVLTWLAGGQMHIDRAAETSTLRYTRDGTTYEVKFTLK